MAFELLGVLAWPIGIVVFIIILGSLKVVNQYERGLKFTLGRLSVILEPGLHFIVPIFQSLHRVDIRQRTIDLKPQDVMTKDKVNLKIDGIVFFSIEKPDEAILNVENIESQLEGKASSELKEIIGGLTMAGSLEAREDIATDLMKKLNQAVIDKDGGKPWGVKIRAVQINNIELPPELVRAMAKQAEAEQEKEARITKAQGEYEASKRFSDAAKVYGQSREALRLRELQTYQEIGAEHNTLMMVIPETMAMGDGRWLLSMGASEAGKMPPINKKKQEK